VVTPCRRWRVKSSDTEDSTVEPLLANAQGRSIAKEKW